MTLKESAALGFENAQLVSLAVRVGGLTYEDRQRNQVHVFRFLVTTEPACIKENDYYLDTKPQYCQFESRIRQKQIDNTGDAYIGVVPYALQMPCVAHGSSLLGYRYGERMKRGYKVLASEKGILRDLPAVPDYLLPAFDFLPGEGCVATQDIVRTDMVIPKNSPGVIGSACVNGQIFVTWEPEPRSTKYGFFTEVENILSQKVLEHMGVR